MAPTTAFSWNLRHKPSTEVFVSIMHATKMNQDQSGGNFEAFMKSCIDTKLQRTVKFICQVQRSLVEALSEVNRRVISTQILTEK